MCDLLIAFVYYFSNFANHTLIKISKLAFANVLLANTVRNNRNLISSLLHSLCMIN